MIFGKKICILTLVAFIASLFTMGNNIFAQDDKLYIGWAVADITPEKPVALVGQLHKRISEAVQDPLNATVLAIETRGENGSKEQAIMVSCDVLFIRGQTQKKIQNNISASLGDFDASKLFLNATHSHTAPGFIDNEFFGLYDISRDSGVMKSSEYEAFFIEQISKAVIRAWEGREPGGFSWGLSNAELGHNRRTVKFNGTSKMYGVGDPDFSHYEGTDDDKIGMLFFWDRNRKLTGILINSVATAQVTDGTNFVSADFYHETRQAIKEKYGRETYVFFQVGSAGDITPANHEYIYRRAENIMLKRKGITARQELAGRLLNAIADVMPWVKDDISYNAIFRHKILKVNLPVKDPPSPPFYLTDDVNPAEIHVIRLGDIAIATNPFELFVDYGLRIKAGSKAVLTFLVQLSCHDSGYLPTEKAVKGGGYSADSYLVGPKGGNKLVEETVRCINELWQE